MVHEEQANDQKILGRQGEQARAVVGSGGKKEDRSKAGEKRRDPVLSLLLSLSLGFRV